MCMKYSFVDVCSLMDNYDKLCGNDAYTTPFSSCTAFTHTNGSTCDDYCSSFGLACTASWGDYPVNTCHHRGRFNFDQGCHKSQQSQICQCAAEPLPCKDIVRPFPGTRWVTLQPLPTHYTARRGGREGGGGGGGGELAPQALLPAVWRCER